MMLLYSIRLALIRRYFLFLVFENDPSRKLMRQIMGAFGEYEKNMIVLKLKVARERKKAAADDHRCEGRKPFGYYEGESEILTRIQALREGGATYAAIAATLNSEGVAPR